MFVDEVLKLVEVSHLRGALVGLPGVNCLSIEQRKRLTIAVELVGRQSCELIKYFEDIDGISKITDGYNPATWMLKVTSPAQEMALGIDFTETYKNSYLYRRNKALIAELSVPDPGATELHFSSQYSQTYFNQLLACLWKQRCSYWRNTSYTAVRLLFATAAGLSLGSMFWDLGSKVSSRIDLFNATGSMDAACLFLGVQNSASAQPVVDVERTVYYRERAAGMLQIP